MIYNYSIKFNDIVKKLYIECLTTYKVNQQETFIISILKGSSETLRSNIKLFILFFSLKISKIANHIHTVNSLSSESMLKSISIHHPTHVRPLNDNELGHYLAGLLDGDGYFHKDGNMTLAYDIKDLSAAYWLKSQLGFGTVSKIKDKNGATLVISHSKGIFKVIELINGKLRTNHRYQQVIKVLSTNNNISTLYYNKYDTFDINKSDDFNNHWLAGFIDSDGSLQIKLITRKNRDKIECRLKLQIAQKHRDILDDIKVYLGGYVGTRKHKNINGDITITYYYETISFGSAKKVIEYLDRYHMISHKSVNYTKWRKAYLLVQSGQHITPEGIEKIKKLKDSMSYLKKL